MTVSQKAEWYQLLIARLVANGMTPSVAAEECAQACVAQGKAREAGLCFFPSGSFVLNPELPVSA